MRIDNDIKDLNKEIFDLLDETNMVERKAYIEIYSEAINRYNRLTELLKVMKESKRNIEYDTINEIELDINISYAALVSIKDSLKSKSKPRGKVMHY